ncbi:unnamed protein product [Malus baccata var. baccata]
MVPDLQAEETEETNPVGSPKFCLERQSMLKLRNDHQPLHLEELMLSFDALPQATNNFDTRLLIGESGFGNVYRGTLSDGRNSEDEKRRKRSTFAIETSLACWKQRLFVRISQFDGINCTS